MNIDVFKTTDNLNSVNKVYENGETTLHTAVIKGEETSVEILLSLG